MSGSDRSDLIIRLIEAGFKQSIGNGNEVTYSKKLARGLCRVWLRRGDPLYSYELEVKGEADESYKDAPLHQAVEWLEKVDALPRVVTGIDLKTFVPPSGKTQTQDFANYLMTGEDAFSEAAFSHCGLHSNAAAYAAGELLSHWSSVLDDTAGMKRENIPEILGDIDETINELKHFRDAVSRYIIPATLHGKD